MTAWFLMFLFAGSLSDIRVSESVTLDRVTRSAKIYRFVRGTHAPNRNIPPLFFRLSVSSHVPALRIVPPPPFALFLLFYCYGWAEVLERGHERHRTLGFRRQARAGEIITYFGGNQFGQGL